MDKVIEMKKVEEDHKVKRIGEFSIIEDVERPVAEKVVRVLPNWLADPVILASELVEEKTSLLESFPYLDEKLTKQLKVQKISHLFPVQKSVIPYIFSAAGGTEVVFPPKDVCVAAPTGSGKTLSYVLPLVQVIGKRVVPRIRAIIIVPVAELAIQVVKVLESFGKSYGLSIGKAFGGVSFETEQSNMVCKEQDEMISIPDIVVGTPQRVAMHASQTPGFDLSACRFLVLDEADHLLAGDWAKTIEEVIQHIERHKMENIKIVYPKIPCQKLLFSATLTSNPEQLHYLNLFAPILFQTSSCPITKPGQKAEPPKYEESSARPSNLEEEYLVVDAESKPIALYELICKEKFKNPKFKAIVFANSKELVHKLAIMLDSMAKNQFRVDEFSSAVLNRYRVFNNFKRGKTQLLVSTDAMARGMDINKVNLIISYEVINGSTYTHRVGRTARAGKPGKAISLVTKDNLKAFKILLGKTFNKAQQLTMPQKDLIRHESKFKIALEKVAKQIHKDKKSGKSTTYVSVKRNFSNLRESLKSM